MQTSLKTDAHLCEKLNPNNWPPETLHAEIRTNISGITSKENQSETVFRALALEEIGKHYPSASWTHIYTDGSAENAENQSLGVCIGFVPDIQVCGTHGREDLVNATITSNAEEELANIIPMYVANSTPMQTTAYQCM